MADEFDLDRVINDPAYRRRVIARLNGSTSDELVDLDSARDRSTLQPGERASSD
jgi:hypothetical protein